MKTKKVISVFLAVLLLISVSSLAFTVSALEDETTYGGVDHGPSGFIISYLDPDHKTCRIDDLSYFARDDEEIIIPSKIDNSTVVSIKRLTFYNSEHITKVVLPDTLKTIGDMSFVNTGITEITIPSSVEQIGSGAFALCDNLETATVNGGIIEGSKSLFSKNPELKSISIPEGTTVLPDYFASECPKLEEIVIPDSVTTMGTDAFRGCTGLKTVDTGDGLTSIEGFDFSQAEYNNIDVQGTGLESIIIGDSVERINDFQFTNCTNLTSVEIGSSVEYIGDYAFYNCPLTSEITIPDSVTRIYNSAFAQSENIKKITTGSGIKNYNFLSFFNIPNLETVIIADGTVSLGNGVFGESPSLKEMYIPASVTSIDNSSITKFSELLVYGYNGTTAQTYANRTDNVIFVSLDDIDKTELESTISKATNIIENESDQYTQESIDALKVSLEKAKTIYNDKIALQGEIDSIVTEINTIIDNGKKPERISGDVNNNGKLDLSDALLIQQHLAKISLLSDVDSAYADINGDGNVNISDVVYIQMVLAKLI